MKIAAFRRFILFALLWCSITAISFAQSAKDLPPRPSPQRLVNDLAGIMTPSQQDQLEQELVAFDRTTSTQITIVTVRSLNGFEPSEYATALGQTWGVGQKGKNNGVIVLVATEDRKMNISPGYGLEGALTDAMCGRIIRNEMAPEFKAGNYYLGLDKAAKAIIAATKGEYTNDASPAGDGAGFVPFLILFVIIVIIIVAAIRGGGKGGGGGNYMSRRGGDFITGAILGSIFSGGGSSGGGSWGGGSSGGGGFGGFGGGSFGGGGASGSW